MRRAPDARGSQPRTPSACHMRPVTAITARCTVHCSCTAANPDGDIPNIPTLLLDAQQYGLVPIIELYPYSGSCSLKYSFSSWGQAAAHFVNDVLQYDYPASTGGSVYFEFGNEVNLQNFAGYYPAAPIGYAGAFANAAAGLYSALSQNHYASFHIITAGMSSPTASPYASQCSDPNVPAVLPHGRM